MKTFNLYTFLIVLLLLLSNSMSAQAQNEKKSKFFLTTGYGLAGGVFVRTYEETLPFPSALYRAFSKKNFIGNTLEGALGMKLGKRYELKTGINYQRFSRRVKSQDTLSNVVISVETTIQERNYMYFASINRLYEKKRHSFSTGLGIYYMKYRAQHIEYGYGRPNFFSIYEPRSSYNDEGGFLADLTYEYKFQPKVNLGFRTQLYYTASLASVESITLFPFIRISF